MAAEANIPEERTPALAPATTQLWPHTLRDDFPVVTAIRPDATPDQLGDIGARVQGLVEESGLAA